MTIGSGPNTVATTTQLQHATENLHQLVADIKASLWDKTTHHDRRLPHHDLMQQLGEQIPPVRGADRPTTRYRHAFLHNTVGVLDVEGNVPRETNLGTSVAKVMLSKSFAAAMRIHKADMDKGIEFVTVSEVVEEPMGLTKNKVVFLYLVASIMISRV